jgi:3'-phosphoadenosine 5'-phosphosulfate sulfotransferase (PAPS reductase)/FAD synthetase
MINVIERNRLNETDKKIADFLVKQKQSYEFKKQYAEIRAWEFYNHEEIDGNAYVAVGGLDSITLLLFLRSIGINVPGVSVSVLEDKSIQRIHEQLGVIGLKPLRSKVNVIQEFGFPVLSKEIAGKIALLQNPSEKNKTVRHAIITGETGEYGGNRTGTRMKLPQKWLELFGGYENENEGVNYRVPDFKVSEKCCYYLKEKPCDDYSRETGRFPYMGLMASEGGRRQKALMIHGCNYISPGTKRSCPFAIFNRQDILTLALELEVPIPEIYGEIVRDSDGTLRTTKAQRTGCSMCGFGIHLDTYKRPHHFDLLREQNPKEWEFWMKRCYVSPYTGERFGWGHVLDYIRVPWEDEYVDWGSQQISFDQLEEVG